MKFAPTIHLNTLDGFNAQPGQWISLNGSRGRYMGRTRFGTVWVAWGGAATKRLLFSRFATAFHRNK